MLEQLFITFQILIIDVVMAADNAIIIGLIAANFAPDNRKKIIALLSFVDNKKIYSAEKLKVGLFKDPSNF